MWILNSVFYLYEQEPQIEKFLVLFLFYFHIKIQDLELKFPSEFCIELRKSLLMEGKCSYV